MADAIIVENNQQTRLAIQAKRQVSSHQLMVLTSKHKVALCKVWEDTDAVLKGRNIEQDDIIVEAKAVMALKDIHHQQKVQDTCASTEIKCNPATAKQIGRLTQCLDSKTHQVEELKKLSPGERAHQSN